MLIKFDRPHYAKFKSEVDEAAFMLFLKDSLPEKMDKLRLEIKASVVWNRATNTLYYPQVFYACGENHWGVAGLGKKHCALLNIPFQIIGDIGKFLKGSKK